MRLKRVKTNKIGRRFFIFVLVLVLIGFLLFFSAALGLLGRDGASYRRVVFNQFSVLIVGIILMLGLANYDYHHFRRLALPLFILSLAASSLVFLPGLGLEFGGARRWLTVGQQTFQPAELLKLGFTIYLGAWLTRANSKISRWQFGPLPFLVLVAVVGTILIGQPDLGTFAILAATATAMFFVAGARLKHLFLIGLIGLLVLGAVIVWKPYARERLLTYWRPQENVETSAYQINQSLITIGSGGLWGKGFGQGVQKFHYLPEPIGDSIFSVVGEEFGFVGTSILVILFVIFTIWSLSLATRAPDDFGRVLVTGITFLIAFGAFVNIASMLGLLPLTGVPLTFLSQGGSSLLFSLIGCGIILKVARQIRHSISS